MIFFPFGPGSSVFICGRFGGAITMVDMWFSPSFEQWRHPKTMLLVNDFESSTNQRQVIQERLLVREEVGTAVEGAMIQICLITHGANLVAC
jgi:hypothetical protein